MEKRIIKLIPISLVLVVGLVIRASGQTQPRTIADFYLSLPGTINAIEGTQENEVAGFENDFLFYSNERNESKAAIAQYRKSLIKIEDLKNGYLRLESNKWHGWVEVALFKRADGSSLVAISQVECGPECSGGVIFCSYRNGHWKNVTAQIFPGSSSHGGYYALPRVGTSITLVRNGEKLAEYHWNKEKFIKQ